MAVLCGISSTKLQELVITFTGLWSISLTGPIEYDYLDFKPISVLPLGDQTLGYDVNTGRDALHPKIDQPAFFTEKYPTLPFDSVEFSGSNYVEVNVSSGADYDSFGFSGFFYPTGMRNESLLHLYFPGVESTQQDTDVAWVKIWLESGCFALEARSMSGNVTASGTTTACLKPDEWNHVNIVRFRYPLNSKWKFDAKNVENGPQVTQSDIIRFSDDFRRATAYNLRIGGEASGSSNFQGRITCLVFYGGGSPDDMYSALLECQPYNWKYPPPSNPIAMQYRLQPRDNKPRFFNEFKNRIPASYFNLATNKAVSRIQCGSFCLSDAFCDGFIFNPDDGDEEECILFYRITINLVTLYDEKRDTYVDNSIVVIN